MTGCSVPGCTSRSEHGFILFQVPNGKREKSQIRRKLWLERIGRPDNEPGSLNYRICVLHFNEDDFRFDTRTGKHCLRPNAMPVKLVNGLKAIKNIPSSKRKHSLSSYLEDEINIKQNNNLINIESKDEIMTNSINNNAISIIENAPIIILTKNNKNANENFNYSSNDITFENIINDQYISACSSTTIPLPFTTTTKYPSKAIIQDSLLIEKGILGTNNKKEQELTLCTNPKCTAIKFTENLKNKQSMLMTSSKLPSKNSYVVDDILDNTCIDKCTKTITDPVLNSLIKLQKSNSLSSKTLYCVRGNEINESDIHSKIIAEMSSTNENNLNEKNTTTKANYDDDNKNKKIQIIYRVMPNTHAHIINYIRSADSSIIIPTVTNMESLATTTLTTVDASKHNFLSSLVNEDTFNSSIITNDDKSNHNDNKLNEIQSGNNNLKEEIGVVMNDYNHNRYDADCDDGDDVNCIDRDFYTASLNDVEMVIEKEENVITSDDININFTRSLYNDQNDGIINKKKSKKITKSDDEKRFFLNRKEILRKRKIKKEQAIYNKIKKKSIEDRLKIVEMKNLWSTQQINKMKLEIKHLKCIVTNLTKVAPSKTLNDNNNGKDDVGNENDATFDHVV